MDSALGINHLQDTQYRFQQNLRTSLLTCKLHKSRISDVTFDFTLHESEGMCVSLLLLLTYVTYLSQVPPAPASCTAVPELMQYLQIFSTKK
jgi:hypothetical protein